MKKIFASALAFDDGKSGISNYIENTLYSLASEHKVYVAILKKDINNFTRKHENIHFIAFPNFLKYSVLNLFFHMFILPFFIGKKYDFIFLPAANRRLMAYYPIFTIATFHDLSQFNVQSKYDVFRMFYIKHIIPIFLKPIKRIIAVSNNTKIDLQKHFKIDPLRITVNYNGVDTNLFKESILDSKKIKEKLDLQKEYLLYVSRIEYPGKNHLNLIKAYEALPKNVKDTYDLVLVGTARENSSVVFDYINNSKDKKSIKVLGFLENKELPVIFSNAKLFVFPSFYEGFGIPLIEAMTMKIPTLCASNSSLLEIGKNVSKFFDEYNHLSIKESILEVLNDEKMQVQMVENGLNEIKKYDWSYHANKIIELYRAR
ncbi:glycosyltransferase family 4 protein [Poseidonibacter sp.]|uniref:glycosyltransferase family 4 protein n=1 Tax=Poseidonibacter sp. TaxID=2321188 RepID=UPI003C75971B